jgi:TolB-like protein/DNA-binding winged helix-turn-helix (wHTH) protein/Flp pilus assembly protein TadD
MKSAFRIGEWLVEPRADQLVGPEETIKIEPRVMQVLVYLAQHAGEVVTREEIIQAVWEETFVTDEVLTTAISKLRRAFGDESVDPKFIQTIPKRGYRLNASVTQAVDVPGRGRTLLLATAGLLAAFLALAIALNLGGWRDRAFGGSESIESIAVLPLENLSGDPEQEYFADGMTGALINQLAQIRALRVISRTSVMQYKDVRKPLPEIARELNVDAVVEGTVLQAGSRVRITAQLIHAATDTDLWADSYERELSDVLALQSEAVRAIAREIRITVTPEEAGRLARTRSVNPEAYQLYLRGRFEWNKRNVEGFKKSLEFFQQAIKEDPNYALAYAGVADSYNMLGSYEILSSKEAYPKAKAAAERALEIDESLGEAHASLGWAKYQFDWDWSGAETEFKRAIQLAPSHATAHAWYGNYLAHLGRFGEALEENRRAQQLDPRSLAINTDRGHVLYEARRFDQAIEQLHKTLAMEPKFAWAHSVLGDTYEQKGMYEEAIAELQTAITLSGSRPEDLGSLGYTYAVAGRRDEAMEVLDRLQELSDARYVPPDAMAIVFIGLDDKDQAFEWLEKAFKTRASSMPRLKVNPVFDPLRSDPRFQGLLRRMNFPE